MRRGPWMIRSGGRRVEIMVESQGRHLILHVAEEGDRIRVPIGAEQAMEIANGITNIVLQLMPPRQFSDADAHE